MAITNSSKPKQQQTASKSKSKQTDAPKKERQHLTQQQLRFCELYLSGLPAAKAYMQAGYNPKYANYARQYAATLLTKHSVREYIENAKKEMVKTYELNRGMLIQNLINIAMGNVSEEQPIARLVGGGVQEIKIIKKATNPRDRAKATEILLRLITEEDEATSTARAEPIADFSKSIKKNATPPGDVETLGTLTDDLDDLVDSEVPE